MPALPPPYKVSLFYDGAYNDISHRVREDQGVILVRGATSESGTAQPGKASMTLDNEDGLFSRRNKASALFGKIGPSQPLRVSLPAGSTWFQVDDADESISTPSDVGLDVTGDFDLAVEVSMDPADVRSGDSIGFASRWLASGDNRAWAFFFDTARGLRFLWTTDGTSGTQSGISSTVDVPVYSGRRIAMRVTLDADNGDSGHTVNFYWADRIGDVWKPLGDPVIISGTTSIASVTADVNFGDAPAFAAPGMTGKLHRMVLKDGIDGSAVIDLDCSDAAVGATSVTDDTSNVWTSSDASLVFASNTWVLHSGEVTEWPPVRDLSGRDLTMDITSTSLLRRLGQGKKLLNSPMRREMVNPEREDIVAYWHMEDVKGADTLASGITGDAPLEFTGAPSLADNTDWPGSDPLVVMNDAVMTGTVTRYTSTGEISSRFLMKAPTDGIDAADTVLTLFTAGTVARWEIELDTSGNMRLQAYDDDNAELTGNGFTAFAVNGDLKAIILELQQNGSDIDATLIVQDYTDIQTIGVTVPGFTDGGTTLSSETLGRALSVRLGEAGDLAGTSIGHLAVASDLAGFSNTANAILGWRGERAAARYLRILEEEGIAGVAASEEVNSTPMGVQTSAKLVDLLRQCETASTGILMEQREEVAVHLRDDTSLYNQAPMLTLDFSAGMVWDPFESVDDTKLLRNRVTVKRLRGSEHTAQLDDGRLSVQDPPAGAGVYDTAPEVSLSLDAQNASQAEWRLHLLTVDEQRYPVITVNLANDRGFALIDRVLQADVGDILLLTDPPADLGGEDTRLIIRGIKMVMSAKQWRVSFICEPGSPWTVFTIAADAVADDEDAVRFDAVDSTLTSPITATETSVSVTTAGTQDWADSDTYPGDFPFEVRIGDVGGEVVTVTAIDNADPVTDTFTRTETDSWGSADSGQAWTNTGGASTDFDVSGGEGTHDANTVNVNRFSTVTADDADFDIRVTVSTDKLAVGADQQAYLIGRFTDTSNYYGARIAFGTDQAVEVTIIRVVAGAPFAFTTASTSLTHAAGTEFRFRFQVIGSALKARAWLASGTEPTVWDTEVTDTNLTAAGSVGVRTRLLTGTSNAPVVFSFDDFASPQIFTVTRTTGRAWDAGSDVRLAVTPIIPLQGEASLVSKYPVFLAGRRATADLFADAQPDIIIKSASETINSSTTMQDDDELFASVVANATYDVRLLLRYSSPTAADFKCQWTVPTDATINWSVSAGAENATSSTQVSDMYLAVRTTAEVAQLGGGAGTGTTGYIQGVLTTDSTAGTLQFQWAQVTSDAGNTQVRSFSVLELRRTA